MITKVSQQAKTYDLFDSSENSFFVELSRKTARMCILSVVACLMLFFHQVRAQDTEAVSSVVLSNFMVSEIVNNPETMNVEGYYLELTIYAPEKINSLTFSVKMYSEEEEEEEEADLRIYPMEVLKKDDGIYLVIQHNHFKIEDGNVRMHLTVEPENLVDNTKYKLTGLDIQGYTITPVEFSHFQ